MAKAHGSLHVGLVIVIAGCSSSSATSEQDVVPSTQPEPATGSAEPRAPAAPSASLSLRAPKRLRFTWRDVAGETSYALLYRAHDELPFAEVARVAADTTVYETDGFLPALATGANYVVQACNDAGCTDSAVLGLAGTLVHGVGYFKASNPDANDMFGYRVAISGDGQTLAVASIHEDSNANGENGDQNDNSASTSGAVYVYRREPTGWAQVSYLKASNSDADDHFGYGLAVSADGSTIVVGANSEDSNATTINGNQADNSGSQRGAVYVFERSGTGYRQQVYLKDSKAATRGFGNNVQVSANGGMVVVEYSNGATVFERNATVWTEVGRFGYDTSLCRTADQGLAMNGDGTLILTCALGAVAQVFAKSEGSWVAQPGITDTEYTGSSGIALSQDGRLATAVVGNSKAALVFSRNSDNTWTRVATLKSFLTESNLWVGAVALSKNGDVIALSTTETTSGTGVNDVPDRLPVSSGVVYVYQRRLNGWTSVTSVKGIRSADRSQGGAINFGNGLALSSDGSALAVTATADSSSSAGIGGNPYSEALVASGAVFLY